MGGPILTRTQLQRISQHRFQSKVIGKSLLHSSLEPFWKWVTLQLPIWILPGCIVLLGCSAAFLSFLFTIWRSPTSSQSEVSIWNAVVPCSGIIIYQTASVIGGRGGYLPVKPSPIDQIIYSGCSAVFTFTLCLVTAYIIGLIEHSGYMVLFMLGSFFTFYLRYWENYVNGQVLIEKVHSLEVQLMVVLVHLLTAANGTELWNYQVVDLPYIGAIQVWKCTYFFIMTSLILNCKYRFSRILAGGTGKNGSSIAGTSILSPGLQWAVVILFTLYTYKHSRHQIFQNEPILTFLAFCPCTAKITGKLQLSIITQHPIDITDNVMLGPLALVLISYLSLPVNEYYTLIMCLIYGWLNLIIYNIKLCMEISTYLKLNILTVTLKKE